MYHNYNAYNYYSHYNHNYDYSDYNDYIDSDLDLRWEQFSGQHSQFLRCLQT